MFDASHAIEAARHRPLPLRMRPDLSVHAQECGAGLSWVVKDPVGLRYYQLRDEELAILRMLDGRISVAQVQRNFEARFAPLRLQPEQILAFLSRLHESGLLISDAPGQTQPLLEEHRRGRRQAWLDFFANILAIRIGALDPEPLLRWLAPKCQWLFSGWFLGGCAVLTVCAALQAAVQFDTLRSRLPDVAMFFTATNLIWLALALVLAKGLHELGHALTCKHFGGECHEIGILLLAFIPCLYCNVSDAWLLPGKWQRIAVSAAGIAVEVGLASGCLFLWWFSEPGVLHAILLNVVMVCSVNTLLLNGNPLMRYDGYYILSDFLGVPNLAQQSRALLHRGLRGWFLSGEPPVDRSLPETRRPLLVLYTFASACYRWFVVAAILYLGYRVAKPCGLEVLVDLLAVVVVGGMLLVPARSLLRFLDNPLERRHLRRGRIRIALGLLLCAGAGLLLVPLPHRVAAPVVLQPQGARRVYVTVSGTLVRSVAAGALVREDEELGRLVNLDLRREIAELTSQRNEQRRQLENLRARQSEDSQAAAQIPVAEAALADIEERLRGRQSDEQRLVLRAPMGGTVIPPPCQPDLFYRPGSLGAWQGTPLESRTLGAHLDVGTLFCLIGDPTRLDALLVIDQSDLQFVRECQHVRLQLDELPGRVLGGTIVELSKADLKVAPRELSRASELLVHFDREGNPRPLTPSYQARVVIQDAGQALLVGTRGRAKILVDPQPLAVRSFRSLRGLFHFRI